MPARAVLRRRRDRLRHRLEPGGNRLRLAGWHPGRFPGDVYFVPETQKNAYLKEISSLAKAINTLPDLQSLESLADLAEARHRLLDAVGMALESAVPEARARMIHLEARHAQAASEAAPDFPDGFSGNVIPLTIVSLPPSRFFVLCQNDSLVKTLEKQEDLPAKLSSEGRIAHAEIHAVLRSSSHYKPDRIVHDCICYFQAGGRGVTK